MILDQNNTIISYQSIKRHVCTEIFFSQYKSITTAKFLLGIVPSGCVTFVSQLYSGGISDKEITLLERRDNVIADRGFVMNDQLEPLGCTLNIPPFLNNQGQFSEDQLSKRASGN